MRRFCAFFVALVSALIVHGSAAAQERPPFDLILRGGTIYDGSVQTPFLSQL
jgi:hypothetical protein